MTRKRIVIVGNGVAGRMAAAVLSRAVPQDSYDIRLVGIAGPDESIGPFGPVEIALPSMPAFHAALGVDEDLAIAASAGSFALGTAYSGFGGEGQTAFFPFGDVGAAIGPVAFHQLTTRLRAAGRTVRPGDYSLAALAAQASRFTRPSEDPRSALSSYSYGLHLVLDGYADFLAGHAPGVTQRAEEIFWKSERAEDGAIAAILLRSGERVEGDLFLDCSGARGLLISEALATPFESWRQWLPCDRAQAGGRADAVPPAPYAHIAAEAAGWSRLVPVQGGLGETRIWCSEFEISPDGTPFESGRRTEPWTRNCIAIGAAALVAEPLQSTGLHLVQSALARLVSLFPHDPASPIEALEYNRLSQEEALGVRDVLIARYKLNNRRLEPFWDRARDMAIPDRLAYKIDLFASRGALALYDEEPLDAPAWTALFEELGLRPRRHDALAEAIPLAQIDQHLARIREAIIAAARTMPAHHDYILRHCAVARAAGSA